MKAHYIAAVPRIPACSCSFFHTSSVDTSYAFSNFSFMDFKVTTFISDSSLEEKSHKGSSEGFPSKQSKVRIAHCSLLF